MKINRGIIVLGMHRSGTSTVTNILVNLGFELPGDPVSANLYNPAGYWESKQVIEIHDDFLNAIGRSWSDPRPFNHACFKSDHANTAKKRIHDFLHDLALPHANWVIKDPRMCRLMPLWSIETEKLNIHFAHVLRSPVSVAESLKKRNQFNVETSLLLWLRHNIEAETATRGKDRSWLRFEYIGDSSTINVISNINMVKTLTKVTNKKIQDAIDKTVDLSLVHHQHGLDKSLDALQYHPWTTNAYQSLILFGSKREPEAIITVDKLKNKLNEADLFLLGKHGKGRVSTNWVLSHYVSLADELHTKYRQVSEHIQNVKNLITVIEHRDQRVIELESHAQNLEAELKNQRTHASNLEAIVSAHIKHSGELESHAQNLEAELKNQRAHASNLEAMHSVDIQKIENSQEYNTILQDKYALIQKELNDKEKELYTLGNNFWVVLLRSLRLIKNLKN